MRLAQNFCHFPPPIALNVLQEDADDGGSDDQVDESRLSSLMTRVQDAAVETAFSFKSSLADADKRREIFQACYHSSNPKLLIRLAQLCRLDPSLVHCRASELENYANDGLTPLHAAAKWGNSKTLLCLLNGFDKPLALSSSGELDWSAELPPGEMLPLELSETAADPWAVDLQVPFRG